MIKILVPPLAGKRVARVRQETLDTVASMIVTFEDETELTITVLGPTLVIELSGE
jgi:hypothetical protein